MEQLSKKRSSQATCHLILAKAGYGASGSPVSMHYVSSVSYSVGARMIANLHEYSCHCLCFHWFLKGALRIHLFLAFVCCLMMSLALSGASLYSGEKSLCV